MCELINFFDKDRIKPEYWIPIDKQLQVKTAFLHLVFRQYSLFTLYHGPISPKKRCSHQATNKSIRLSRVWSTLCGNNLLAYIYSFLLHCIYCVNIFKAWRKLPFEIEWTKYVGELSQKWQQNPSISNVFRYGGF